MKRYLILFSLSIILLSLACPPVGARVPATAGGAYPLATSDTLYISTTQTVHLRFASELRYVNLGSRVVVARIVEGSKDFLAIKAREEFPFCTTLSCLEQSGRMHTFLVAYAKHPSVLDIDTRSRPGEGVGEGGLPPLGPSPTDHSSSSMGAPGSESPKRDPSSIPGREDGPLRQGGRANAEGTGTSLQGPSYGPLLSLPQALYHIASGAYGISVICENVLVKDDLILMVVSLRNTSPVSYTLSDPRFSVEARKRPRRSLQYEKALFPRNTFGKGTTPAAGGESRMVFTFDKMTLTRSQVLRAYFYEKGGVRNFVLTLYPSDINGARALQ